MLAVNLILFSIFLATLWILFNANDEVHNVAAKVVGIISLLWFFAITSLEIKLLITCSMLILFQRFQITQK